MAEQEWLGRITGEREDDKSYGLADMPTDAGGKAPAYPQEFLDEYEKYQRFVTAKGSRPGTVEEMWPVYKQNGSLERRYLNPGAALHFADALRFVGKTGVADSIEEQEKRNPKWQEDKEEFDTIAKIAQDLIKHKGLDIIMRGH